MSEPAPEVPQPAPAVPEPVAPALPPDTRFHATPYRPEGGINPVGLVTVLVGLSLTGIVLGVIVYYVSQWFYLIVLFPILIGLALAFVASVLVKKGRIRSPIVAGVAGFLGGLTAMGTTHYCNYLKFMSELEDKRAMLQFVAQMNPANLPPQVRADMPDIAVLKKAANAQTFWDYMDIEATQGVEIKRAAHGNGKGMNLGYVGTWIYWGVETLIVTGIVFAAARKTALEPYCSVTDQWKGEKCGDNFTVATELIPEGIGRMLREGELGRIAEAKAQGGAEPVRLYVYASPEHNPQCTLDVKLVRFVTNKQGKAEEKEVAMATYPHEALEAFARLCS